MDIEEITLIVVTALAVIALALLFVGPFLGEYRTMKVFKLRKDVLTNKVREAHGIELTEKDAYKLLDGGTILLPLDEEERSSLFWMNDEEINFLPIKPSDVKAMTL